MPRRRVLFLREGLAIANKPDRRRGIAYDDEQTADRHGQREQKIRGGECGPSVVLPGGQHCHDDSGDRSAGGAVRGGGRPGAAVEYGRRLWRLPLWCSALPVPSARPGWGICHQRR